MTACSNSDRKQYCVDKAQTVADLLVRSTTGVLTMPIGPIMSV